MGLALEFKDARLVGRALAHDAAAFTELVKRHMPAVTAVGLAYTRNHTDAEDVAQETFLKAWQALDSLRAPRRFGGWVVTIARNVARNELSRRRKESESLDHFRTEVEMPGTAPETGSREAMRLLLPVLVSELSDIDRELVLLHYYVGKKTREIAALLAISHSSVRKRLERIREKLGMALLASIAPDAAESARRDKRAAKIASAVIGVSPPWKQAAAASGVIGASVVVKACGLVALISAVLVAGYVGMTTETADLASVEPASAAPVTLAAVLEAVPAVEPEQLPTAGEEMPTEPIVLGLISGRLVEKGTETGVPDGVIELRATATRRIVTAQTDEDGNYRFSELPAGEYRVSLVWNDDLLWRYPRMRYERQERRIQLRPGAQEDDVGFVVISGVSIMGQVVGPLGEPIAGATVEGWSQPNFVEAKTMTDAAGQFEFRGFGSGEPAFFWPRVAGLAMPPYGPVTAPPEGMTGLVLAMDPESVVAGRLVDQEGNPLPEVRITPWPRNVNDVSDNALTDAGGFFELRGLHASTYQFSITFPGDTYSRRLTNMEDLELAAGEHLRDVELVYELPGTMTISGRVTDDLGAPCDRIFVYTRRGTLQRQAETDEEGYYTLQDLEPGIYQVQVVGTPLASLPAEAGAVDVDFMIPRMAAVHGKVVDARTNEPVVVFEVRDPWTGWKGFRDEAGRFALESLRPIEYQIAARAEGYAVGLSESLTLASGQVLEDVVIMLDKGGFVSGRVLGPGGGPVRDAVVAIDDGIIGGDARTTAEGTFLLNDARPGAWPLVASHPEYAPGSTRVVIHAGETVWAEIRLADGATLLGTVTRNGRPIEGVRLFLTQPADSDLGYSRHGNTDRDGAYIFRGIPEGELALRLDLTDRGHGREIEVPVAIVGANEERLDIAADDGLASAIIDVAMDQALTVMDGDLKIELRYEFDTGEIDRFYREFPYGTDIRFDGLRAGYATLSARYRRPGSTDVPAAIEPHEIFVQDGGENRYRLDFVELER